MNNRISNKDKKDWHNFINSKEKLPNKDLKNNQKKIINTKSLDLHGYTLEDANKKIENFPNEIIVIAYISQIVLRINDAMRSITKKYQCLVKFYRYQYQCFPCA